MSDRSPTPAARGRFARFRASFLASFGEVVFGMEDGTVSIFGLVAGLAVAAQSGAQVVLAGATGAIAAAVSMAAGVFLDRQSALDQERLAAQDRQRALAANPLGEVDRVLAAARTAGLAESTLAVLGAELRTAPKRAAALADALGPDARGRDSGGIKAHAAWMFAANLFAGLTPVLPFAVLPFEHARWASLALTLGLLILLGVGRARVGARPMLPTVLQTVGIAGAAALAGVLVARWLA